ncbi:MAG: hypothetical protein U5O15_10780 [Candidatus Krumholzibacteriota bacterium]|nr:hypothetical protein [Candidatus Krumholzibacteriota bacterium]
MIDILSNIYNNGKYGTKIDEKRFTAEVKEITGHDISEYLRMLVHTTAPDIILGGDEKIKRAS